MKKIILLIVFCLGLLLSSSFIYIHAENELYNPDIRTVILFTPKTLDEFSQWHTRSKSTQLWMNAITAGLYDISYQEDDDLYLPDNDDYYGYYHLDIAEDFPNFVDRTSFQVNINDDIKFSNGEILTVEDVIFSYQIALSPAINKQSYHIYSKYFDSNDSIVIIDENTVEFQMNQAYLFYLELLTLNIIPKSEFIEDIELGNYDWNNQSGRYAVGAGPYRIDQISVDKGEIILLKNTHNKYWESPISRTNWENLSAPTEGLVITNFDRIIIKYAETKELAIQLSIGEYRSVGISILDPSYIFTAYDHNLIYDTKGLHNLGTEATWTIELTYNHYHPIFGTGENLTKIAETDKFSKTIDIRKAISLAIDRDNVDDFLGDGSKIGPGTSTSFFKPKISTTGFNVLEIYYNPSSRNIQPTESAQYLMAGAGFNYNDLKTDYDGKYTDSFFNVSLSIMNDTWNRLIAEGIKTDLSKIGIGISPIVYLSKNEYYSLLNSPEPVELYDDGGFDLLIQKLDWGLTFDPTMFYHSDTPFGKKIHNYNSSELDEIIETYTGSMGYTEVETSYHALVNYMNESEISTPLYFTAYMPVLFDEIILNSVDLTTFNLNWEDVFIDVTPAVMVNGSSTSTTPSDFDLVILTIPVLYIINNNRKKRSINN